MQEPKNDTGKMKMGQLAETSGMPVSTIKFYISQGLLPHPKKEKPNVAFYDQVFLHQLLVIKRMRADGISIKSIKSILDRYPFDRVADWEKFKREAGKKEAHHLGEEERLATLSDEERRSEAILEAALEVFSMKGYLNATVDDVAQYASVSKGTCYQYFSGKEELFISTLDRTLDRLLSEAESAAVDARDALEKLGMKGLSFISNFRDLQFLYVGLFSEIMGGNRRLREKAAEIFRRVADFLVSDIREGIEEEIFRPGDTETVAYALMGIAEIVGNLQLIEDDFDVFGFFEKLMDFLQHGLSAGGDTD